MMPIVQMLYCGLGFAPLSRSDHMNLDALSLALARTYHCEGKTRNEDKQSRNDLPTASFTILIMAPISKSLKEESQNKTAGGGGMRKT